jgi:hypothetical protein
MNVVCLGEKRIEKEREMWVKNWLLGRYRFTHINLLNFNSKDSPED